MRGLAFATIGLTLAGCAGGDSSSLIGSVGGVTTETASTDNLSSAFATTGAKQKSDGFNPFSEHEPVATGGREVIANPSEADIMLVGNLPEASWGRADAPVTIVQYASLTCPHCRRFHLETFPELKRTYIDTGKVRYILREFPIGRSSGNATIALRCAPKEKYLDLYGKFLTQQSSWVSQDVRPDEIFKVASQVGMTRAQFDACLKNQAMIDDLNWVKDRGRKLGIIGTPNFFIAGKLVKSVIGMKEIREMVEPALGRPAATANAKQPG